MAHNWKEYPCKRPRDERIQCYFDRETMTRIRGKAAHDHIPLAEAIRLYVEWGMESEKEHT